jgi:hypothetical protein
MDAIVPILIATLAAGARRRAEQGPRLRGCDRRGAQEAGGASRSPLTEPQRWMC